MSAEFLQAMANDGLVMHDGVIIPDGALHRFRAEGDRAGSLNGWYVFHDAQPAFGAYGSWKWDRSKAWVSGNREAMTEAERRHMVIRMAETKAARDTEQAKVQAAAAVRALGLWNRAKPATNDHAYLARKSVSAFGIRELRGQLLIPVRNADCELTSLQFIGADGKKTFLTGGRKRGCYHAIGKPRNALCIAEGYATAATIFQATQHAVAVAFDAGNLEAVARALRSKFPRLPMVVVADNDRETPGNPGLTMATKAAMAVNATLSVPQFEAGKSEEISYVC